LYVFCFLLIYNNLSFCQQLLRFTVTLCQPL
jgi:hypothetical protein